MLEFKKIEISDKVWVEQILKSCDFMGCEYTFGNNFIWRKVYEIEIARYKDFYILKNKNGFLFPAGTGDKKEAIEELKCYCNQNTIPLLFTSMNKVSMEWLKGNYEAEISTNRDFYDYVYNYESLATLSGKKLHSKRNYINRFSENNWSFEEITPENISECIDMNKKWCEVNDCLYDESKMEEQCAVKLGLEHFFELDFIGGILRVDGKIQAFTFGELGNAESFVVHVEKAFTDYQGAYPMINNCFVKLIREKFTDIKYINREEDMGAENLRKAKLSYYPAFLEEKFMAKLQEDI